jgi:aspartate aminotransferase
MVSAFEQRHDFVVESLNALRGVEGLETDGTFYVLPSFQGVIDRMPGIGSDVELAEHLIEHGGVAVVPGSAFGAPGHMRLSIATSMANLEKALDRLKTALA